jgi:hypothetical protein
VRSPSATRSHLSGTASANWAANATIRELSTPPAYQTVVRLQHL